MINNPDLIKNFKCCFSLNLDIKTNSDKIEEMLKVFQEKFKEEIIDKIDSETEIFIEPILKITKGKSIGIVRGVDNERFF